jgi:hypothetical protein
MPCRTKQRCKAAQNVVERQQGTLPELDDDALFDLAQHGAVGPLGPHELLVECWRHLARVFRFRAYRAARAQPLLARLGTRLELAASCGLSHEDLPPWRILLFAG